MSYKDFKIFNFGRDLTTGKLQIPQSAEIGRGFILLCFIIAYYIGEYAKRQDYTTVNAYYLLPNTNHNIFILYLR
jgi:hypothetical protein